MTNDMQPTTMINFPSIGFGARLQSAREAQGLETKDTAARLRLNEKVILMMETENYPSDLPITFIRGYIRAYGKLLQIPEIEIKKALEPIKPKVTAPETPQIAKAPKVEESVTSSNYYMQIFTYLIMLTIVSLVAVWWYSHSNKAKSASTVVMNQTTLPIADPSNVSDVPVFNTDDSIHFASNGAVNQTVNEPALQPKQTNTTTIITSNPITGEKTEVQSKQAVSPQANNAQETSKLNNHAAAVPPESSEDDAEPEGDSE